MKHFGEIRGYEYTFYVLACILFCSLTVAILFMPAKLNHYQSALPNEAILANNPAADRVSVQAAPIHGIA